MKKVPLHQIEFRPETSLESPCTSIVSFLVSVVALALEQDVLQDIAERQHALEVLVLVDDDESVHAGLADRVEDGVEPVVERARVDAREVLRKRPSQPSRPESPAMPVAESTEKR